MSASADPRGQCHARPGRIPEPLRPAQTPIDMHVEPRRLKGEPAAPEEAVGGATDEVEDDSI